MARPARRRPKLNLTAATVAALFGAMAVLAAAPSVSVLVVSSRAAAAGFRHGASAALGIVTGDIIFIVLAFGGLVLLSRMLGGAFFVVRYVGGAYLIWLAIRLWIAASRPQPAAQGAESSLLSSFASGLLITLGDQKAIVFYLGFLPAFVDTDSVSVGDIGIVVLVAAISVGGVKLGYAWAAARAGHAFGKPAGRALNAIAAVTLLAAGVLVIARG